MIPRKSAAVLLLLLIFFVPALSTGEENLEVLIAGIEAVDAKLRDLSFNYEQVIEYPLTKEKQTSSGEAIFEKPKRFFIHQKKPVEQFLISNGKKVWAYTPSFKQVVVTTWQSWTSANMPVYSSLNITNSLKNLRKQYIVHGLKPDKERQKLEMEFRDGSGTMIDWWMDGENVIPNEILLKGYNVNVRCYLRDTRSNSQYPDKKFYFNIPKGVSVIKAD